MNYITLNNGLEMPQLGFGVWKVENEKAIPAVEHALKSNYRSIDTAKVYGNEEGVGQAIANSGVPREEIFLTTKVWNADHGYDETLKAFDASLERLGTDYVDLYLIHWPTPEHDQYIDTYKALEKIYKDGKAKAIGVCNFEIEHLERLLDECEVVPAVNQVECHPYLQQKELRAFCKEKGIYVEAYSPLMNGKDVLKDEALKQIAENKEKTIAQVILRWHLQSDLIVIPKSVTPSRIEANLDVFDFELNEEERKTIDALDRNIRSGWHPNEMNSR
ncbi:oxidoreductase [Oceanobacillus oncorhynchi subsp. incaldanensis]|uniref:Aldo/keto reductase n=2 Tax=Oceanobacillus TaxID=182709 RepID=A0ABV9JWH6_9BACI|nr:aldo/keto reductase [Oceanobacillus oncorhynchi]MDM8100207.1 aldo/keto reductase [Oceanobacillus oncorhynchi]GIO18847.1 oxidoreductase [Oceanobacillus oncorhynchi subsp. incaldanensis]CEI82420.1 putative oxidoreductase/MSMEI_2347 [Oceanobacillus oncorhynchi]